MNDRRISASVRAAGANFVHEVRDFDNNVVAVRRSRHRYAFAIVRVARYKGHVDVIVKSWSNNNKASGQHFAVAVNESE